MVAYSVRDQLNVISVQMIILNIMEHAWAQIYVPPQLLHRWNLKPVDLAKINFMVANHVAT